MDEERRHWASGIGHWCKGIAQVCVATGLVPFPQCPIPSPQCLFSPDFPMPDFIPRPDAQFSVWASTFVSQAADWYANQGIDEPLTVECLKLLPDWLAAYDAHNAAQAVAIGATKEKDNARSALTACARALAAKIQTQSAMTDNDRAIIGVTIRQVGGGQSPVPTTAPKALVSASERLSHTLRVSDEATPTRTRRPKGTLGAEVRLQLVAPGDALPTDPLKMQYVTLATDGNATATFGPESAGKTAVYVLRWVGPRGAVGPWGPACMATVAA